MQCFTLSQSKYLDELDQINADLKINLMIDSVFTHKHNVFFNCLLWSHMQKQDPNADTEAGRFKTKSKLQ